LLGDVGLLSRQQQVSLEIAQPTFEPAVGFEAIVNLFPFLQDPLGFVGIVPEAGFGDFLFEGGQPFAVA
jgi:hypothetical protein